MAIVNSLNLLNQKVRENKTKANRTCGGAPTTGMPRIPAHVTTLNTCKIK